MKSRTLTFLISIILGILVSCNKDDDATQLSANCDTNSDIIIQDDILDGVWNLRNVKGGLQGIDIDYGCGEVIWRFNETTGVLNVENTIIRNIFNTKDRIVNSGLSSGTYTYEVKLENDILFLSINNGKTEPIFFLNTNLQIGSSPAADGIISEFRR